MANTILRWCIPARLERRGAVIVLNPDDPVISGALTFGVYERAETAFLCQVLRPGMTFLDVGANVGYYTALAIRHVGETGKIIALEPDRENFQYLERTVAANRAHNVTCVQRAAADRIGTLRLYVSKDNRGDNRLYANDLCDESYDVDVTTVDTLLGECGVNSVDLVKMDVQGFEGHIVQGMERTIRQSKKLIMLTEFWPFGLESAGTCPERFLLGLEQAGLTLYQLRRRGELTRLVDKGLLISQYQGRKYTNIVAVRGNSLPPSLQPR
jgi:FkbM family methyltransferase